MEKLEDNLRGHEAEDVEHCGNAGCAACVDGRCEMTFGECFGYIGPEQNKADS